MPKNPGGSQLNTSDGLIWKSPIALLWRRYVPQQHEGLVQGLRKGKGRFVHHAPGLRNHEVPQSTAESCKYHCPTSASYLNCAESSTCPVYLQDCKGLGPDLSLHTGASTAKIKAQKPVYPVRQHVHSFKVF